MSTDDHQLSANISFRNMCDGDDDDDSDDGSSDDNDYVDDCDGNDETSKKKSNLAKSLKRLRRTQNRTADATCAHT